MGRYVSVLSEIVNRIEAVKTSLGLQGIYVAPNLSHITQKTYPLVLISDFTADESQITAKQVPVEDLIITIYCETEENTINPIFNQQSHVLDLSEKVMDALYLSEGKQDLSLNGKVNEFALTKHPANLENNIISIEIQAQFNVENIDLTQR